MAHRLQLDIRDSTYNNRFILVSDLSIWDEVLQIKYRKLQVHPPYADEFIDVMFPQNQVLALNSNTLRLSVEPADLPDGPYRIHYSVSPNHKVYIDTVHYRTSNLMNAVYGKMADFSTDPDKGIDSCGNIIAGKMETSLLHIQALLKGAQAIGRQGLDAAKSKKLYEQAMRIYDKLFGEKCKGC